MEIRRLHEEYHIEDVNPMNIYRKSLNSISKINNQKTTMDFDKILNEKSVMEYSIDTNQPKMFSEEMIKGRFYGPPTPLQTDYTFEMLNNANVYMLRFYTSALNFYNRLVCILESIIHETSSTHHSSDFIRYSQKHILLKGKASNTITILDELMASKQRVGHSLEALYMDCICRLTGKTDMQETCWKWLVRNSKLINAIMKRVTVVETIESIRNEGTGKMVVIADFTKIIEAVIKATYNQYMVKLSDVGRNMMEIVCMLEIENHYMKYMVMARRLDAGKNQANTQKKRALYLSTEVIQKTKMHGQNKRAVTFHQLAQRGAKIGNPMVAMAQSFKKFSNLSNNRKEGSLSVNRDRSLPSVSGLSTDKSYRKTPNEKSKSQDKEYLTQYQTFLNMRKDLGQQFSQLSKYKNRLLAPEDEVFNMQITRPTISSRYLTKYKYRVSKIGKSSGVGTKSLTQEAMRNNIRQQMGHTNPEDDENSFRHVLNDINDISLVNKRRNRRNDPDTLVDGDLPELTNYVDAGNKVVDKSDGQFAHQLSNILRKRNVSISDIKIPAMAHNHTIADSMKSASMSKLSKSALFRINETKRG